MGIYREATGCASGKLNLEGLLQAKTYQAPPHGPGTSGTLSRQEKEMRLLLEAESRLCVELFERFSFLPSDCESSPHHLFPRETQKENLLETEN